MGFFQTSGILNRRGFFGGVSETAPFNPASLSGLKLWLKADAGVTLDGSNVTAWADQSGNGNDASGVDFPTLNTINGKNFVNFAGGFFTGDELITESYATILAVAEFSSTRDIEMIFEQYSYYDNLAFYRGFDLDSGFRIYNGNDLSSASLTNDNQTYLFGVIVNGESSTLYLNGFEDAGGFSGNFTPSGSYYIGRWQGAEATTTEMNLAEIVIYNRSVTIGELNQVQNYLNNKYEIY